MESSRTVSGLSVKGQIDAVDQVSIHGWLYVDCDEFRPLIIVNGNAFFGNEQVVYREDVNDFIGIDGSFGFAFPMSCTDFDQENEIELYAITPFGVIEVFKKRYQIHNIAKVKISEFDESYFQLTSGHLSFILIDLASVTQAEITNLFSNQTNKNLLVVGKITEPKIAYFNDIEKASIRLIERERLQSFCTELSHKNFVFESVIGLGRSSNVLVDQFKVERNKLAIVQTLVLVWKMPDAGVYGRRIDQIARSYKRLFPNCRVIVIEVMTDNLNRVYRDTQLNKHSDSELILTSFEKKKKQSCISGINYLGIIVNNSTDLQEQLNLFVESNQLISSMTQVVFFPILPLWHIFLIVFRDFKVHVDVVDNELSWCKDSALKIEYSAQYKAFASKAQACFFNSKLNERNFSDFGIIDQHCKSLVVENWYSLPPNFKRKNFKRFNWKTRVLYSGNLNDRIDWDLLYFIVGSCKKNAKFSIIGNASRVPEKIEKLLSYNNVEYLGPLAEEHCLKIIGEHDLAIVPHKIDAVSRFMNPLKVLMYEVMTIPTIVMSLPGVEMKGTNIVQVSDKSSFVEAIISFNKSKLSRIKEMFVRKQFTSMQSENAEQNEERYFKTLNNLVESRPDKR